jgi:hypothetical protein
MVMAAVAVATRKVTDIVGSVHIMEEAVTEMATAVL